MIDHGVIYNRLRDLRQQYSAASPFPHVVVHDLLPEHLLRRVVDEFPDSKSMQDRFDAPFERKWAEARWERFGPATRCLVGELNSGAMVRTLEALTGIPNLIVDSTLNGGGLHQIERGGVLGVHADYSNHRANGLERRLNLLLYLNDEWDERWGGQLELWDRDMTRAQVRVEPEFGTVVVFSTTSTAFHGHPDPLATPPGITRRSLALYYFTNTKGRTTHRHSTVFQSLSDSRADRQRRVSTQVRRFVPPAVLEAVVRARERRWSKS